MTMRFTAAFLSTAWVGIVHWLSSVESWSHKTSPQATRHEFLQKAAGMVATGTSLLVASAPASVAASSNDGSMKLTNLSNADIEKIVVSDLEDRHFLVTGDLTRSIYDESATFTDEIDTYAMDQWMKGTAKLFVGKGSKLDIIGNVEVSPSAVEFRFEEDLMFRIPLRPVVHLTGKVVLKRSPETGLITSYQEFWDQDVLTVLKSAKI